MKKALNEALFPAEHNQREDLSRCLVLVRFSGALRHPCNVLPTVHNFLWQDQIQSHLQNGEIPNLEDSRWIYIFRSDTNMTRISKNASSMSWPRDRCQSIRHYISSTQCKPPFIFFIKDRVVFWMLFLLPDWRLVCAVPALQKLQPLLLQRVHPGACHRDQEPAKEIQIHGHPCLSSEPHTFASFTSECPNKCDQQQWGGDRPEGFLAKSGWRCCCVKNKQQCFHVSSHWVN